LPVNICHAIYDILVKHTGASANQRDSFVFYYSNPDGFGPTESHCCSRWGMAGKFWWNNNRFYVSARSLSECDHKFDHEREMKECDEVNVLLAPLYVEFENYRLRRQIVDATPAFLQHQGSLTDQLEILAAVANKIGLRDAADFITGSLEKD
jgi:hypothetical protein